MNKDRKIRLVLTGGHAATTALSVIEEIIRRSNLINWEIYWIGARSAIEGKKIPTLESTVFPKIGVVSYPITAGKLQRKFTLWTIPSALKIPVGFFHALILLLRIKPDIILSFGGFAALPVVIVGFFLGIPVCIHEQTAGSGLANRISSPFAKKILLARYESQVRFSPNKTLVVGNPIMTQIAEIEPKEKPGNPPYLFIAGGSRGSQAMNNLIKEILPKLLRRFNIIHHTGYLDYQKCLEFKSHLSSSLKKKYEVYKVIDPLKIDDVYRIADIVIARAGANTVSEVIAVKRPAILIPLNDEQRQNARLAQIFGVATILEQDEIDAEGLHAAILKLSENWYDIVDGVKNKQVYDKEASRKVIDILEKMLK